MMNTKSITQSILYGSALTLSVACTQSASPEASGLGLSAEDMAMLDAPAVDCSETGDPGEDIDVGFECSTLRSVTAVQVASCKDLSNVVLEFEDGSHQKTEGLSGTSGEFAGTGEHEGKAIANVWVKSGSNHSDDGPGYGERFEAPERCNDGAPGGDSDAGEPSDDSSDPDAGEPNTVADAGTPTASEDAGTDGSSSAGDPDSEDAGSYLR